MIVGVGVPHSVIAEIESMEADLQPGAFLRALIGLGVLNRDFAVTFGVEHQQRCRRIGQRRRTIIEARIQLKKGPAQATSAMVEPALGVQQSPGVVRHGAIEEVSRARDAGPEDNCLQAADARGDPSDTEGAETASTQTHALTIDVVATLHEPQDGQQVALKSVACHINEPAATLAASAKVESQARDADLGELTPQCDQTITGSDPRARQSVSADDDRDSAAGAIRVGTVHCGGDEIAIHRNLQRQLLTHLSNDATNSAGLPMPLVRRAEVDTTPDQRRPCWRCEPELNDCGVALHWRHLVAAAIINPYNRRILRATDHMEPAGTVTSLLRDIRDGKENAEGKLYEHVYGDLREIARDFLQHRPKGDLQATALVHAAYERIKKRETIELTDRHQFFHVLSRAMHDVLVEQVRSDLAAKRGGGVRHVPYVEICVDDTPRRIEILDLHEALADLGALDPEAASVAIHRFYLGRTIKDTSDTMDESFAQTRKHWDYAKAWLHARLTRKRPPEGPSA